MEKKLYTLKDIANATGIKYERLTYHARLGHIKHDFIFGKRTKIYGVEAVEQIKEIFSRKEKE